MNNLARFSLFLLIIGLILYLFRLLDARHDKHEMIFKLSRDITTDSKRLIFSILRLFDLKDKESGLKKLHGSLDDIGKQWSKMSKLLADVKDPSLVQRAFSPGLQEYIEALSLLSVLEQSQVPSTDEVCVISSSTLGDC